MEDITLIMGSVFPVPAVKGGAVENLIENIAKAQEKEKKVNLNIICAYDFNAEKIAKEKFKNTNFNHIKVGKINKFIDQCISFVATKIFHKKNVMAYSYIFQRLGYYRKISSLLHKKDFGKIILENSTGLYLALKWKKNYLKYEGRYYYHCHNKVNMDFSVNINPLGIPHSVKEAMSDALSYADRYPDMACSGLKKAISEYFTQQGCSIQSEDVIPGNGASELFMAIAHAIKPKKAVLPAPGFFGYEHVLRAVGCDIGYFLLDEQSDFSPAARLDALMDMLTDDTDIFFIANPNNPTGYLADSTFMKQIIGHCKEKHIYVVADECFMDFCEKNYSVLPLLCDYDNLIVVRAFTKLFAIPGVRLGYMLSKNEAVRQKVQRNLPEWNVSVLAQMAGEACIMESEYIKETASYVSGQRRLLSDGLKKLGFKVYKSDADFILFYSKLPLYDILLNKGILIRDCSNYVGLSEGYFRVAVKTFNENVRLLKVIGECIEKN